MSIDLTSRISSGKLLFQTAGVECLKPRDDKVVPTVLVQIKFFDDDRRV